jgi:hypothetical protein
MKRDVLPIRGDDNAAGISVGSGTVGRNAHELGHHCLSIESVAIVPNIGVLWVERSSAYEADELAIRRNRRQSARLAHFLTVRFDAHTSRLMRSSVMDEYVVGAIAIAGDEIGRATRKRDN